MLILEVRIRWGDSTEHCGCRLLPSFFTFLLAYTCSAQRSEGPYGTSFFLRLWRPRETFQEYNVQRRKENMMLPPDCL